MSSFIEHFRFAQIGWLLLLLPALLVLVLRRGRGSEAAVVFPNLSVLVSLGKRVRRTAGGIGLPLALLALITAILAMARPVWRNEYQSRTASGIDIMIAFDVSLSMDIDDFIDEGERVKRIDVAKMVVDDFIRRRPDDRMGLVAFAGRPRDASPITLDHKWLRNALNELRLNDQSDRGTIKEQGTAIGSALSAAATRLDARDAKSKIIVLITDGASNSGGRRIRQDARHQDLYNRHRHQGGPGGSQHHAVSLSGIRPPDPEKNRLPHRGRTLLGAGCRSTQKILHHHRPT